MWQLMTAVEHLTMLPNRITCQQKWLRRHLFQEGGERGNHSKLADKGRVCLFVYLWRGGGKADILHLHFIFTFYITFYRSSFLNSPRSNQEPYRAKAYLGFCKHKASTHFNPWVERGWESRVLLKKKKWPGQVLNLEPHNTESRGPFLKGAGKTVLFSFKMGV